MEKFHDIPDLNLRFGRLFKSTGMSQKEFGEILGISQNQVSNILLGKRGVTAMLMELIRLKLNVNPRWLLHGEQPVHLEKPGLSGSGIPILDAIPPGAWQQWIHAYTVGSGEDYIDAPGELKGKDFFAVRMRGDSMEPILRDRDILVINPYKHFVRGIAVVRHEWGYKIRTVRKHDDSYIITPYNPAFNEEEIVPGPQTRIYVPVKIITLRDI